MFKRGEIGYKETILGGCASTSVCDQTPIELFSAECLEKDCRNLILNRTKLLRAIKAQDARVAYLEGAMPESVEFRAERATLNALIKAETRYFGGRA